MREGRRRGREGRGRKEREEGRVVWRKWVNENE